MPYTKHKMLIKNLYTLIVIVLLILPVLVPAAQQDKQTEEGFYSVLDPRGIWPRIESIPLSPRLSSWEGKRIYLINSWSKGSGFEALLQKIAEVLRDRHAGIVATIKERNTRYSFDDTALWQEMQTNADAFIYAGAPSSSTTSYAFKWSAKLEKMGLPGAVLMFDTLMSVADTTRKREGAEIRYTAIPFPAETMSESLQNAAIESVLSSLTAPLEAHEQQSGYIKAPEKPRIMTSGSFDEIQEYFHAQGMSDGLPIVPPTEARVEAMLKGTSHDPDTVVVKAMMPEGLKVTVEKAAINAVMAGCKPNHLPVLLATLEAYSNYSLINSVVRSTNSFSIMQVVNGPIRRDLEMNAGTSVLGPGNHANAAMGRALRLFITNLGGGIPGKNLMAIVGNISVEHTTKSLGELRTSHFFRDTPDTVDKPDSTVLRVFKPGSIHIVVAGGDASPMMQAWHMSGPLTVSIDKWR